MMVNLLDTLYVSEKWVRSKYRCTKKGKGCALNRAWHKKAGRVKCIPCVHLEVTHPDGSKTGFNEKGEQVDLSSRVDLQPSRGDEAEYYCQICGQPTIDASRFETLKHLDPEKRKEYRACRIHMIPFHVSKLERRSTQ